MVDHPKSKDSEGLIPGDTQKPVHSHDGLFAHNIQKAFKDRNGMEIHALEGFCLHVKPGEFVSLIGSSGCGKSTFLRLAAGLEAPHGGELLYNGETIRGTDPGRGFVFQNANLFPWLTVYENIAFGLKATKKYKGKEQEIRDFIKKVGLEGFEKSYPYQLSGGMASRTSLARTFITAPRLILLDEPLSALDAFTRKTIQDEILRIWNEKKPTILLVTHDIEEAVYMSSRVVVLSRRPGTVIGDISIDMDHPRDPMSDTFIDKRKQIMEVLKNETI